MIVRTEPKDWMMHSVLLYFDNETPDGEDAAAKQYLADNNLIPKRTFTEHVEDRDLEVYSFGGCYLGNRHLTVLAAIQRKSVERELLADKIVEFLVDSPSPEAQEIVDDDDQTRLREVVAGLVEEYDRESSFEVDDEGQLQVALTQDEVLSSFQQLLERLVS